MTGTGRSTSLCNHKEDSEGQCILYADLYGFGQTSVCNYCISVAVLFLTMCVAKAAFRTLLLTKYSSKLPNTFIYSPVTKGVVLLVDMIALLFLLVASSLISAGFSHLCSNLFHDSSECDSQNGVGIYPGGEVNDTYYNQLSVAQGAAWFTFGVWLLVVVVKILIFWKEGSLTQTTSKAKTMFGKSNSEV